MIVCKNIWRQVDIWPLPLLPKHAEGQRKAIQGFLLEQTYRSLIYSFHHYVQTLGSLQMPCSVVCRARTHSGKSKHDKNNQSNMATTHLAVNILCFVRVFRGEFYQFAQLISLHILPRLSHLDSRAKSCEKCMKYHRFTTSIQYDI